MKAARIRDYNAAPALAEVETPVPAPTMSWSASRLQRSIRSM